MPGRPRSLADGGPGGPSIPGRLSGTRSVFPSSHSPVAWFPWHVMQFNGSARSQDLAPLPLHQPYAKNSCPSLRGSHGQSDREEEMKIDRKRKVETLGMATTVAKTQWYRLSRTAFLVTPFSYRLSCTAFLVPPFLYRLSRTASLHRLSRTDFLVPPFSYSLSRTAFLGCPSGNQRR